MLLPICLAAPSRLVAQTPETGAVDGYITAVTPPNGFTLNHVHLTATNSTLYGRVGGDAPIADSPLREGLQVGAQVHVVFQAGAPGEPFFANVVLFGDDHDHQLGGYGLIDKMIESGPEPLLQADGYRIRIAKYTKVTFHGQLKSIADINTNTWVKYVGERDEAGVLVATAAEFFPARRLKAKPDRQWVILQKQMEAYAKPANGILQDSLIDADGHIVVKLPKVRYSDSNGNCGWHKVPFDPALQERVRRVGTSLIPKFQRDPPADDPQKIAFRFYAVDDPRERSDIFCNEGLILVPQQAIGRLQNDDQLAALLADGIAFNLQVRSARLLAQYGDLLGLQIAGEIVSLWAPGVDLATYVGASVANREIWIKLQEQRGRMVLAMMQNAGYDPWQAPEAWRWLEPKSLPPDLNGLKYPSRSKYQLDLLNVQYKRLAPASTTPAEDHAATANQR